MIIFNAYVRVYIVNLYMLIYIIICILFECWYAYSYCCLMQCIVCILFLGIVLNTNIFYTYVLLIWSCKMCCFFELYQSFWLVINELCFMSGMFSNELNYYSLTLCVDLLHVISCLQKFALCLIDIINEHKERPLKMLERWLNYGNFKFRVSLCIMRGFIACNFVFAKICFMFDWYN